MELEVEGLTWRHSPLPIGVTLILAWLGCCCSASQIYSILARQQQEEDSSQDSSVLALELERAVQGHEGEAEQGAGGMAWHALCARTVCLSLSAEALPDALRRMSHLLYLEELVAACENGTSTARSRTSSQSAVESRKGRGLVLG